MFSENCLGGSGFSSVNGEAIRLSCVSPRSLALRHLQHLTKLLAECEAASGLVFEKEIFGKPQRRREGWTEFWTVARIQLLRALATTDCFCSEAVWPWRLGWIKHQNVIVDPWLSIKMRIPQECPPSDTAPKNLIKACCLRWHQHLHLSTGIGFSPEPRNVYFLSERFDVENLWKHQKAQMSVWRVWWEVSKSSGLDKRSLLLFLNMKFCPKCHVRWTWWSWLC